VASENLEVGSLDGALKVLQHSGRGKCRAQMTPTELPEENIALHMEPCLSVVSGTKKTEDTQATERRSML
jgi:hypothetical protein